MVASIVQLGRLQNGDPAAVLKADRRVKIGSGVSGPGTALWIEAEELDPVFETDEIRALAEEYKHLLIATLQRRDAWQVIDTVNKVTDPCALADLAGYASWLTDEQKRELLETPYVADRLRVLVEWVKTHIAETEVNDKIADDVREGMEKSQREFLLRQQLNAIRKELGEDEPEGADDYRGRVEAADLPDDVRKAALREVGKLERGQRPEPRVRLDPHLARHRPRPALVDQDRPTPPTSARPARCSTPTTTASRTSRTGSSSTWPCAPVAPQRGLELVGGRGSGAVMVLAGPPGVGKTSLGESVARALGRKFVRVALGGVRDEAEIRGHRRTYVGALPGRIVRAISEAGSMNPVVLLDEIDKVGSDYRGDPSAALLEVLDPAQNHTFRDHYLEVDLDLSDVLFLATANVVENIPQPLLDRMELVTPRRLHRGGQGRHRPRLPAAPAAGAGGADRRRGAGRRRRAARDRRRLHPRARRPPARAAAGQGAAQGDHAARRRPTRRSSPLRITRANLREFLGRPRFTPEAHERTSVPGVATGLAVTGMGGDTLFIEASVLPASEGTQGGGLTLTGQLGDVMKESAHIALSYVRAHAEQLGITDPSVLDRPIHVHVPAGAVPKDGPSAGVTMVTALTSMATGRPVRGEVGMTGEVTLNGRVLPIGGLKQKLLAAQRAGLTTVFVPQRNAPDLDEVPSEVTDAVEVVLTTDVADAGGRRARAGGRGRGDRRRLTGSRRAAGPASPEAPGRLLDQRTVDVFWSRLLARSSNFLVSSSRKQVVRRRNYRLRSELVLRAPVGGELQACSVGTAPSTDVRRGRPLRQERPHRRRRRSTEAVRDLRRLILAAEHYRQSVSDAIGLGTTESQAVSVLALHGERGQSDLARDLQLTSSASTALVDRLERQGVAERTPPPVGPSPHHRPAHRARATASPPRASSASTHALQLLDRRAARELRGRSRGRSPTTSTPSPRGDRGRRDRPGPHPRPARRLTARTLTPVPASVASRFRPCPEVGHAETAEILREHGLKSLLVGRGP